MTNVQRLEFLINLARAANAPAETHERALALAKELAPICQAADEAAAGKKDEPSK